MLDAAVTSALLVVAIATIVVPGEGALLAVVPAALAGTAVAAGVVPVATASGAARSLGAPLAFVLFAVPLAVLLDRFGFFAALAELISTGRRYRGWLWLVAAAVTAGLNLDAAVVLLTPLYVRIAGRRGISAFALAIQPALLSGLASSALPISNLTNLIAAARLQLGVASFVVHLGVPTVVATGVGWLLYDRSFDAIAASGPSAMVDTRRTDRLRPRADARRVLVTGGAVVVAVVSGFLLVPLAGGQPWQVAAAADAVLVALTQHVPWRAVPWRIVVAVLGLGVLASATSSHLPVHELAGGGSAADLVRTAAVGTGASLAVNNLPALLVALPGVVGTSSWAVWALLLGTNVGALLVPSGSLAVLLWLSALERLGVPARQRHWFVPALRVAAPALAASVAALVLLRLLA